MVNAFWECRVSVEECIRVLARAGLPPATSVTRIPRGEVNAVFDVALADGQRVVLKVQVRPGRPPEHLRREQEACELLRRVDQIPVPEVLAVDTTREVLPHCYSVLSYLEGEDAINVFPVLGPEGQRQMVRSLGRGLAEVHGVTAPARTEPALPWSRSRAEWVAMMEERFRDVVRKHQGHGFVPRPVLAQAQDLWEQVRPELGRGHFCLLHGDGHLANARTSGGGPEISGLLDFDQTDVGEAEFDFAPMETWRPNGWEDSLREAFYKGYEEAQPRPAGHEARVRAYTLLRYLGILWAYQGPVRDEQGSGVSAESIARFIARP